MARILANPFGELRGKFQGGVFTRTKAGQVLRAYVVPVNPNSNAQQASRSFFRSAAQAWKTLTAGFQATWKVFADGIYNPLRKINVGQFTGNQAFVAIATAVNNALQRTFSTVFTATGVVPDPDPNPVAFTIPTSAPLFSVLPEIAQDTNPPTTLAIDDLTIDELGAISLTLTFPGAPVGALDADNLQDSNGIIWTVSVYISDVIQTAGGRPKNEFFQRLGNAELVTFSPITLAGATDLNFAWTVASLIPDFKQWVQAGQNVLATVVILGQNGTQVRLGQVSVEID